MKIFMSQFNFSKYFSFQAQAVFLLDESKSILESNGPLETNINTHFLVIRDTMRTSTARMVFLVEFYCEDSELVELLTEILVLNCLIGDQLDQLELLLLVQKKDDLEIFTKLQFLKALNRELISMLSIN